MLFGVGARGLADPRAVVMGLAALRYALPVARAVAGQHVEEFLPVDLAMAVMARALVERKFVVRHLQAEELGLRHRDVDELLPQLVVGVDLDYSEISGGGKSMLLVAASGTAVVAEDETGSTSSGGE